MSQDKGPKISGRYPIAICLALLLLLLAYRIALPLAVWLAVILLLLAWRAYLQHKVRRQTAITSPNGIDSLERTTLGGVEQWLSIRGWDTSKPVLLYLHGGPGYAQVAVARFFQRELERCFVVVQWDQRGAGKSYSRNVPRESMNVEQFISDTRELVEMLKNRFHAPKVYLVGHSWGSMLGMLLAARHPDLIHAFVGVGQFVEDSELEQISYRYVLDKATAAGDRRAIKKLAAIGPPPYKSHREMRMQRAWLEKYGGTFHRHVGDIQWLSSTVNFWIMGLISPDASLMDAIRYFRGQTFSMENMWDEVSRLNLFELVPRVHVPVYFFLGRYDYNTPTEIVERYCEQLEAPRGKQIIWFEDSAHGIPNEEEDKFCSVLSDKVMSETRGE